MEVLRLAGSPGVGKSTAGWAVAARLAARGESVAYLDIDQVGMCYPAPVGDPDRWALKELALAGIVDQNRRAGINLFIVSGVASPDLPPPTHPGVGVQCLWLDAAPDVRRARLRPRGWDTSSTETVVAVGTAEAARLETSWERLGTDGLTVRETVDAILARWPVTDRVRTTTPADLVRDRSTPNRTGGRIRVLWITGPRCAGASTVGWLIAEEAWGHGHRTGFLDIAQLSFTWHLDASVGLTNGVALVETFASVGAQQCVVVAPLEIEPSDVRGAFWDTELSVVRLDAADGDLHDRALARARGEGPMLAGDDLLGTAPDAAKAVITSALVRQRIAVRPGETLIDTSGTDPVAATARVRAAAGW